MIEKQQRRRKNVEREEEGEREGEREERERRKKMRMKRDDGKELKCVYVHCSCIDSEVLVIPSVEP